MTLWSSDFEGFNKSGVCVGVWVVVIVVSSVFVVGSMVIGSSLTGN